MNRGPRVSLLWIVNADRIAVFEHRELANVARSAQPSSFAGVEFPSIDADVALTDEAIRAIENRNCLFCSTPLTQLSNGLTTSFCFAVNAATGSAVEAVWMALR